MEFVFLGTCAGVPAKGRNVSATALRLMERGTTWLFDCGEGTQHQILYTNVRLSKIEKIFITHLHGDHIFGLPGLLGSRSFQGGTDPIAIYGPRGIQEFIETSLRVSNTHLKYEIHYVELEEDGIIFKDDEFEVHTAKVKHGLPSYGFRIVESEIAGVLLTNKLQEKGIQPGPIYREIKNGKNVCLDSGEELNASDYVGESIKGRIVTYIGDTRFCKESIELAREADLVVHEATFNGENEKAAYEFYHSTSKQAAKVALESGAKRLVINHISSRYQGEDFEQLIYEAKEIMDDVHLAHDFDRIEIPRKKREEKN